MRAWCGDQRGEDRFELVADLLASADGQTVKELVERTGWSSGIVRRTLGEMEQFGLVVKTRGEQRAWLWWLA
jgi:DNA-binding MarR family transcriptional regulator